MTWNKEAARRVTSEWGKIGKMERDEADAHVAKIIADTFREEGPRAEPHERPACWSVHISGQAVMDWLCEEKAAEFATSINSALHGGGA